MIGKKPYRWWEAPLAMIIAVGAVYLAIRLIELIDPTQMP